MRSIPTLFLLVGFFLPLGATPASAENFSEVQGYLARSKKTAQTLRQAGDAKKAFELMDQSLEQAFRLLPSGSPRSFQLALLTLREAGRPQPWETGQHARQYGPTLDVLERGIGFLVADSAEANWEGAAGREAFLDFAVHATSGPESDVLAYSVGSAFLASLQAREVRFDQASTRLGPKVTRAVLETLRPIQGFERGRNFLRNYFHLRRGFGETSLEALRMGLSLSEGLNPVAAWHWLTYLGRAVASTSEDSMLRRGIQDILELTQDEFPDASTPVRILTAGFRDLLGEAGEERKS